MKKRLVYLDIFRSFGIILMIMGHIGFGTIFDKLIHAFHMPMFFFISGFLYRESEAEIIYLLKRKAKSLLLPYAFFGIFHFILNYIMTLSVKPLYHLLMVNTEGLPIAGALWFLTALFWTDILYFILDKKNLKILIILLVLIGCYAESIFSCELPWALSASFVGLGLYWIGNMTRKFENKLKKMLNLPCSLCILGTILAVLLILKNGYVNMRTGMYANIFMFFLCATLCNFIGISVSKIVEKGTKKIGGGTEMANFNRSKLYSLCLFESDYYFN